MQDFMQDLLRDLVADEALRLKPYRCTEGKLTIGIGRNLDDVGITQDEAFLLCQNDIRRVQAELDRALPWWRSLSENRQRALANMAFNLGVPRLLGFRKMLVAMQEHRWEDAAAEALNSKWAAQVHDRARRIARLIQGG